MSDLGSPVITCASCSAPLPASAKFCLECGTPVADAAPAREIRKTVTLLFTDVTGSTAMGETLDPEAYRGVMGRYFDVARAAVERHGGTVEKFVGDAVLAVFGVPEVREDDALRAVRAADELNRAVRDLSATLATSHGVSLTIRTGINTGAVVAGTARAGGSFATGDAVNTAARLEQAAGPGEILLGVDTWRLVRDAVEVEAVDPVTAKGKAEAVSAYRLLAVHTGEDGLARSLHAPMVGRDREIRALDDALERTLESGRSHLVTVLGAPGIGKTRLVSDFVARIGDRADVASGRCVSYGQGITFFPVVQVIRTALRLAGGETDEIVRHAIATAMAGAADETNVVDLLLPLLGAGGVPGTHQQTFWAVRRLVEQLAQVRPLVVTVDDLQWAEPSLLDLLAQVQDEVADLPFLLICGARPELMEEHPDWGRGSLNSTTFGLEPFDTAQSGDRISAILGEGVPDSVVTAVADWSGGNPLFVEEIVSHLVEEGALVQDGDWWTLVRDSSQIRMPPTVSALLAARLDRLPAPELELLQRVSVIGLEFTTADAIGLVDDDADRPHVSVTLSALARRDLLRRVRSVEGESWAFRHITIRDAAYDVLPKALRADLHERFAEEVADAGAERLAFVGHHLEQAARLRRELAPHDPRLNELVTRAAETLAEAADEARERDDDAAAGVLLQRAIDLHHPSAAARRDLLVRMLRLTTAAISGTDTTGLIEQLAADTDETASPLDLLTLEVERLNHRLNVAEEIDPTLIAEACDRLERLARDAGDPLRVERAQLVTLWCSSMSASWSGAERITDRLRLSGSLAGARTSRLVRSAIATNGTLPFGQLVEFLGSAAITENEHHWRAVIEATVLAATDPDGSRDQVDAVIGTASEIVEVLLRHNALATIHQLRGDLDEAIRHYGSMVDIYRESGAGSFASTYLALMATLKLERGDPLEEARTLLDDAERCTSPYDVLSVALNHQVACVLAAREGRLDDAGEHAERGERTLDGLETLWSQADLLRQVSELPRMTADAAEERRLLSQARDLYRRKEIAYWAKVCEERLAELD